MAYYFHNMKNRLLFLFFLAVLPCFYLSAQTDKEGVLLIDGVVYGYNHDPSKGFLKKEKQIVLEGSLSQVSIDVFSDDKSIYKAKTNKKGEFLIKLNLGKIYKVEFSKGGYTKSVLLVDTKVIPKKIPSESIKFIGAEIILNSFKVKDTAQANLPYGRLFYNIRENCIDFEPNQISKKGLFTKHDDQGTPIYLMRRSVNKNKDNLKVQQKSIKKDSVATENDESGFFSDFDLDSLPDIEQLTENNIKLRESEIENARRQLEEDKMYMITRADSLLIKERERSLNNAIVELANAKKLIALQKLQLDTQRKLLFLSVCCLVLLSAFLFIFFFHYKEKKSINVLLKEQNKKITDSINYAKRIQQSILVPENEIQKILPRSFIYYQPRDIVSGDFYWFSQVDNKIIIAAVDCTGHGVPGAFMSLIGNTLLNEIINEKGVTDPASILNLLHLNVLKALHQLEGEAQNQDGMEMSLCVIDHSNKTIEFAGAMTPVYVVNKGAVSVIQPDTRGIGGINAATQKGEKIEFTTKQIPIEEHMCLYMFTDGYMDQFGGPNNKKFNAPMFKKMLLYFQVLDMEAQKSGMEEIMKNWRGDYRQIDDMLVIGIRF